MSLARLTILLAFTAALRAQTPGPENVLVVVNASAPVSTAVGQYYIKARGIPLANLVTIRTPPDETIGRTAYEKEIETPIGNFLKKNRLTESILYIVLTTGVPLRVNGANADTRTSSAAAVDSELTLLYQRLHGITTTLPGPIVNPFFRQRDVPFRHPSFPMYLVTRLDSYNLTETKKLIDRGLLARNVGKFVVDVRGDDSPPGNQWLRAAAVQIPKDRLVLDDSPKVLTGIKDVIGYASWGSNDFDRHQRFLNFTWLPGAIATEFVSSDGRTFKFPPDTWNIGTWKDESTWFAQSPQTLSADYIHEGASGASGQVFEPWLDYCPRPEFILPAYYSGRNLAESFYLGIPAVSWMNIVIGDPLTRLK